MRRHLLVAASVAFCLGVIATVVVLVVGIAMIEPVPPPEMWMTHRG